MIDKNGRLDLLNRVKKLNEENNITVILISHYVEEIAFANRVVVIDGGKLLLDDTPRNIVLKEKELYDAGIILPYIPKMANKLKDSGKNLKGNEFTVDELCQFLK